jgi:hypothetical protein
VTWRWFRRHSVPVFIRRMVPRHPELARVVLWDDFVRMAQREKIAVRVVALPDAQKARLVRVGQHVFIQLNRLLSRDERTIWGMHELCHFWRDDPGVPCYYGDEHSQEPEEEFADVFAWAVTSYARVHVPGIRPEDLEQRPPEPDAGF